MLRSLCVVFLIVFVLYACNQGQIVDDTIAYVKDQANYTQQHGVRGLIEKMWCGTMECPDE